MKASLETSKDKFFSIIAPCLAFALSSSFSLFAQSGEIMLFYKSQEYARYAVDLHIMNDNSLVLMASEFGNNPPYNGVPIEGEACYGNVFIKLNDNGEVLVEEELFLDRIYGKSYIPASFLIKEGSGAFKMPFSLYVSAQNCEGIGAVESFRRGLTSITINQNDFTFKDSVYNENGFCEVSTILGASIHNGKLIIVEKDDHGQKPYMFRWFDNNNNEISTFSRSYPWFYMEPNSNNLVKKEQSLLLLGSDKTKNHLFTILEVDMEGDSIDCFRMADSDFRSATLINQEGDGTFLAASLQYIDNSNRNYFVSEFDIQLNELWRTKVEGTPINATKMEDGSYLLVHNLTTISHISSAGEITSHKEYGLSDYDRIQKIVLTNKGNFAALGTRDTGFIAASPNNPYAWIYIIKDQVSNLRPTGIDLTNHHEKYIYIYPNPVASVLNINLSKSNKNIVKATIFDLSGKPIYSIDPGIRSMQVDVSGLLPGMYYLELLSAGGAIYKERFIKSH